MKNIFKSIITYLILQSILFAFAIDFINHTEKYSTIAKYQNWEEAEHDKGRIAMQDIEY